MRKVFAAGMLIALLLMAGCAQAEAIPATIYGGSGYEIVNAAVPLPDGGFLLAGNTDSVDGDLAGVAEDEVGRAWAWRVDAAGGIVWQLFYGEPGQGDAFEQAMAMEDGTYLLAHSSYTDGKGTFSLVSVSGDGDILSEKVLDTTFPYFHVGKGGMLMTEPDDPGKPVTLLDARGQALWREDLPEAMQPDGGGILSFTPVEDGYLVGGGIGIAEWPEQQAMAGRMLEDGRMLWTAALERSGSGYTAGIAQTQDGGALVVGNSIDEGNSGGKYNAFLAAFSPDGTLLWERAHPEIDDAYPCLFDDLITTEDGFLALATRAYMPEEGQLFWLLSLDAQGDVIRKWSVTPLDDHMPLSPQLFQNGGHTYVIDSATALAGMGDIDVLLMPVDAL